MDPSSDLVRDVSTAAMKASPPAIVAAYAAISQQLPVMVGLATLIYIILQAAHLVWKWVREARRPTPTDSE